MQFRQCAISRHQKESGMFEQILTPLDGSRVAATALPVATTLASALRSRLTLLSVVEPITGRGPMPDAAKLAANERATTLATAYLESVATPLRGEGITVTTAIRAGDPAESIITAAEGEGHALIVIATNGRSGIQRLRLGSVTRHVIQQATVPTLVVGATEAETTSPRAISEVVVTLDGSELSEMALAPAAQLARALGAPLTLFRVVPSLIYAASRWGEPVWIPPIETEEAEEAAVKEYLVQLATPIRQQGQEVQTLAQRSVTDRAEWIILDYLSARPAAIAVMSSRGQSGVRRWILGSTTEAVVTQPPCPVLVIR
jgi:nucleotide-binding universal stress UspA family protein